MVAWLVVPEAKISAQSEQLITALEEVGTHFNTTLGTSLDKALEKFRAKRELEQKISLELLEGQLFRRLNNCLKYSCVDISTKE